MQKHGNVFKNWLCPNFLLLPKKSELPIIWGGCSPPRPPGPYAYARAFLTLETFRFFKDEDGCEYIPANSHACGLKTSISRRLTPAGQFLTPD